MFKGFGWGESQRRWISISYSIFYLTKKCLKRWKCPSFNVKKWMELASWMKMAKFQTF
ncbi:hypothetical protein Hanom_Chr17g01552791 [Helianthus anomalus]